MVLVGLITACSLLIPRLLRFCYIIASKLPKSSNNTSFVNHHSHKYSP